ncbi:MAG: 50S ribosomal protein L28 [Candidatus Woykebacteria bacterium RBG_16_44_10]|uniref:Large ribosomal subunit protein bL28 n=1 Tax=Candidatus Woykebacteria bacterium RBG_16_44_10 TaxID=1802597 RepID=A0A1G1WDM1_9BACT|nr:MAG: 50S ribosomal protein L28 [Candidatus Woykebacteria bacterium RBG_16_44_10]
MGTCDRCGKGVQVGMNVSHSHVRTKKRSYPNLHSFKIRQGSLSRRLRLCTQCLRIVKKQIAERPAKVSVIPKTEEIGIKIDSGQEKRTSDDLKSTAEQKDLESVKEELTKVI